MAARDIPFSALLQPANPARQTVRNAVISSGDDFTVTITLYQDEDANAPIASLIGVWAFISFFDIEHHFRFWNHRGGCWDYGFGWPDGRIPHPILTVQSNPVTDVTSGSLVFAVPPEKTQRWRGRYAFIVQFEGVDAGSTIIRGILDVSPGLVFPARPVFSLAGAGVAGSSLDGPDAMP